MKTLDELRAHHDYLTTELANTKDLHDKMPIAAELEVADMELRARITEGISVERLMEMCQGENEGRCIILPCEALFVISPCECERCNVEKTDEGACAGLCDVYAGKHPKYGKRDDWEFMVDNCPREVVEVHPMSALVKLARNPEKGKLRYYFTRAAAEAALQGKEKNA